MNRGKRFRENVSRTTYPLYVGTEYENDVVSATHVRNSFARDLGRIERTWDDVHRMNRRTKYGKTEKLQYNTGGPFLSIKARSDWQSIQGVGKYRSYPKPGYTKVHRYVGGFIPSSFGSYEIGTADYSGVGQSGLYEGQFADSYEYGAELWNIAKPKPSLVDLGTFIGELREMPSLLRQTAKFGLRPWAIFRSMKGKKPVGRVMSKDMASDFLGIEFGWKPFIAGLLDTLNTYRQMDRAYAQLLRDNGQWLYRKRQPMTVRGRVNDTWTMSTIETRTGTSAYNSVFPRIHPRLYAGSGLSPNCESTFHRKTYEKIWFVGRFRYHIPAYSRLYNPLGSQSLGRLHRMLILYGVRVTPSTVWNLMPWSWLIDWATGFSSVLDYVTDRSFNNLTAKYAYAMKQTSTTIVHNHVARLVDGPVYMSWEQAIDSKCRQEASPFGFDLVKDDIIDNPLRVAILSALGIGRLL